MALAVRQEAGGGGGQDRLSLPLHLQGVPPRQVKLQSADLVTLCAVERSTKHEKQFGLRVTFARQQMLQLTEQYM